MIVTEQGTGVPRLLLVPVFATLLNSGLTSSAFHQGLDILF